MTYNFIICKNGTTEKVYKDNTTSQGKKQAVENALKALDRYGRTEHYAVITSFDWTKGYRMNSIIR